MHQALAALHSLCTEGCARTIRSMCVGIRNVNLYGPQLLYSLCKFGQVFLCALYVRRVPRELADSWISYPQEVEGRREVSTLFFVDKTLSTNYQWQRFEGCPIQ